MSGDVILKLIIDTEQYAGNFEREMCAYCTGQVGDCGAGGTEAQTFEDDGNDPALFEEYIAQIPDKYACCRPAQIEPTPGWANDGMGKMRALGPETEGWENEYPAYMSVGIYFDKAPPKGHIELLKKRAYEFAEAKKIKITAFRFVREETVVYSVEGWDSSED